MEERGSKFRVDLTGQLEVVILDLNRKFKDIQTQTSVNRNLSGKEKIQLEKDMNYLVHGEINGDSIDRSYSF